MRSVCGSICECLKLSAGDEKLLSSKSYSHSHRILYLLCSSFLLSGFHHHSIHSFCNSCVNRTFTICLFTFVAECFVYSGFCHFCFFRNQPIQLPISITWFTCYYSSFVSFLNVNPVVFVLSSCSFFSFYHVPVHLTSCAFSQTVSWIAALLSCNRNCYLAETKSLWHLKINTEISVANSSRGSIVH